MPHLSLCKPPVRWNIAPPVVTMDGCVDNVARITVSCITDEVRGKFSTRWVDSNGSALQLFAALHVAAQRNDLQGRAANGASRCSAPTGQD